MKLTVHMLIKNEQRWIWFALKSIAPFVDRVIIFDTGSSDKTLEIIDIYIKQSKSKHIEVYKRPIKNRIDIVKKRQQMVEMTQTEWFLLVDGDEVWGEENLKLLISKLESASKKVLGAVVRTRNCVGDIFHYQRSSAGQYRLKGRIGHLSLRAFRKDSNYQWQGQYPLEGYMNKEDILINDQDDKLIFIDTYFYHLTHLKRSDQTNSAQVIDRLQKYKLEIGRRAKPAELPKVFFEDRPSLVPDPFSGYTWPEYILAHFLTPLKKLKSFIYGFK